MQTLSPQQKLLENPQVHHIESNFSPLGGTAYYGKNQQGKVVSAVLLDTGGTETWAQSSQQAQDWYKIPPRENSQL